MTDPTYGDNPLDAELRWFQTMRPPLVNDPEIRAWQAVIKDSMGELAESSWSVRWRTKSASTAFGVHLDAKGADLGFLRPGVDPWDDDRYRATLLAIEGATIGNRPPSVTSALADALIQDGQTWEMTQADPLTYRVYMYGLTADDAVAYFDVLRLGKPTAIRLVMVHSTEPKAGTFVLDSTDMDGPDLLVALTTSES